MVKRKTNWLAIWLCASFAAAELVGASLAIIRLRPYWIAKYRGAGADLRQSFLQWAPLHRAILTRARLQQANLRGADLDQAALYSANLSGADLSGADLDNARIIGANLQGASLRGAAGYQYLTTPHPVAVLTPDEGRDRARQLLPGAVSLLAGQAGGEEAAA